MFRCQKKLKNKFNIKFWSCQFDHKWLLVDWLSSFVHIKTRLLCGILVSIRAKLESQATEILLTDDEKLWINFYVKLCLSHCIRKSRSRLYWFLPMLTLKNISWKVFIIRVYKKFKITFYCLLPLFVVFFR